MKAFAAFLLLLLPPVLLSGAVYPADPVIGQISKGNAFLLEAVGGSYDENWIEKNVCPEFRADFAALHDDLAQLLPLTRPLMSERQDGLVLIRDSEKDVTLSVFLCEEGLIESLSLV